ncbi:MAG: alpha/beta hydrolase family protein [Firmicutes bacterium]|nr:alpha/beta hydrolase family protein [Bacillota bacterium]
MLKLFSRANDIFTEYRTAWLFAFSHGLEGIDANEKTVNGFWEQEYITGFDPGSAPEAALVRESSFPGGRVSKLIYSSPVTTPIRENNLVHGRLYTPPRLEPLSGRPALLIIPGWLTQGYQRYGEICRGFLEQGIDCLILAIPYHLERTPEGCFSGERFFAPDLYQIMEAMGQALADCRLAVSWLLANGASGAGILGFDLGGLIGGLLATLEPRLAFASLWAPIPWLERALRHSSYYRPVKDRMFGSGIHWQELSNCLETFDPTRRQPVVGPDRIQFVQGSHDRIVRPSWTQRWWEEWGKPDLRRVPHGHFSLLKDRRVIDSTIEFTKSVLINHTGLPTE